MEIAKDQIALMEAFWKTKVYAMSSHKPMRSGKTFSVPGVIDVYDGLYIKEMKYMTDSTQRWREGVITFLLEKYPKIHLLTHDYCWSEEGHSWETTLQIEAKKKFDAFWNCTQSDICEFRQGLLLREEKDKEFQKRYMI
jgi:hypothetical protein